MFSGALGPLIVEIGTPDEFSVCAGYRCILAFLVLIRPFVVKHLVSVWSAFGWVLERLPAYDWPERLTTNSRSFIIDTGC